MDVDGYYEYRKLLRREIVRLTHDRYFEMCLFKGEEWYILQGIVWFEDFNNRMSIGKQEIDEPGLDRLDAAEIIFDNFIRSYGADPDEPQSST